MIEQLQKYYGYVTIILFSLICIMAIQIGAKSIKTTQINLTKEALESTYYLLLEISNTTLLPSEIIMVNDNIKSNEFQELMRKSSPIWHTIGDTTKNIPNIKYKILPKTESNLLLFTPNINYNNSVLTLNAPIDNERQIEIELYSDNLKNSLKMIDKYSKVLTVTTVIASFFTIIFISIINRQKNIEHQFIQSKKNIENQVYEDALTKMPNRRKFDKVLDDHIFMAQHFDYKFSLAIFDIDHFKQINDTFGHKSGDEVLKNISTLLKSGIRHSDICARWGGEEFAIILSGADINMAIDIVEKLRQKIEQLHNNEVASVTCSFGVCEYSHNLNSTELFTQVDALLYKAKNSGRNRVESSL